MAKEKSMQLLKIGISGVRGIVGQTITPELALNFASAFGTWLGEGPVLIGRDTRPSGPILHQACLSALISTGCDVIDLGICPTPILQFMVRYHKAKGGISISAGHNGKDWNALTFINSDGTYLNSFQGEEVLDLYHLGQFNSMPVEKLGKVTLDDDYIGIYFDALSGFVDVKAIQKAGMRIIVDCCNGAGAKFIEDFGEYMECEIVPLNNEQNGYFPHDPEPCIRNAQQVSSVMEVLKADAGFLTNSDVSRISLIAMEEQILSEEYTFPLIAKAYLKRKKGPVVTTMMTSSMIDEVARKMDCPLFKTKVGQSHVIETMLLEDAVIAGEGSGGVAVPEFQPAFDGFLSMALVLEAIALGASLGDLAESLPLRHLIKEQVGCPLPRIYSLVNEIKKLYPGEWLETSDGIRLDTGTGWIHLRASATEPLVRVYVEDASRETARERAEQIIRYFPYW
ncbi:MAG: phosphoglucosamine mutase [Candidatus Xenobiia bacterium LiM19]